MDNWNPLHDDFVDPNFNCYNKGPGSNLPRKGVAEDGVQLYVGGIPISLTKDALCNLFSQAGKVKEVKILPTKNPGSLDTFGFVTMSNLKEATDAITMLNHFQIDRFFLKVRPYQSKENRQKWKKRKEEEEAFLMSLNQHRNHSQSDFLSNSDSDGSFNASKTITNGVKNGDTRSKMGGRGRGLLQDDLSLAALDSSVISQGPSTDSVSSRNSLSDLTITVDQQLRQVRKGETTSEYSYSGDKYRSCGRGITSLQQNLKRGSIDQNEQSHTNKYLSLKEKIPLTQGGKPCLYCRKKASLLCTRCKMPYCSVDCQKADWPKHRIGCSKISTMPKEINLDPDEFEVSVGEDIVEYLPSDSRTFVKKEYGEKLKASYQSEKGEYESVGKISPVNQSSPRNTTPKASPKKNEKQAKLPTSSDLPKKQLPTDTKIRAMVTHVETPDAFWLCDVTDIETSMKLCEQLSSLQSNSIDFVPKQDQIFMCMYLDTWYRCKVLSQVERNVVRILYLDFGNSENVPFTKLRPLPNCVLSTPELAVKCKLVGIAPRNSNDGWPKDCLSEILPANTSCTITKAQRQEQFYLVDVENAEGQNVIETLLKSNVAKPRWEKIYGKNVPTLMRDLRSNQDIKVFIVLATSPEDFIVQIDEPTSKATLEALTNELYKIHENQKEALYMPEVGELVSCKYEDGQWYRGSVQHVTNASAIVYFLDFGNVSEIPLMRIRPGLSEHSDYPCQAIRCCLKNVKPLRLVNSIKIDDTFSDVCLQHGCRFQAKIYDMANNFVTLDLYDSKGNSVLDKLTQALGKEPISNTISASEISFSDQDISCVFTGFVSDTEFCVYRFESQELLVNLHQDINRHCSSIAKALAPSVGDYVCALFDGEWYRAQVKSVQEQSVSVFFVDYGNSSDVLINDVRRILPEYLKLPHQAIKCSFDGINETLDHEIKNQMTSILQNSPINIKFVSSSNGVWKVQVTLEGNNINDCLKETLNPETEAPVAERTENPPKHAPLPESREDSPKQVQIPPPEIPADGQEISCVFSGFVSDTEFCVSKLETLKEFIELGENITKHCKGFAESGSAPLEGDYVCALFEGSWYRGRVKSVKGDLVSVYYVDYGNSSDISVDYVRTILPEHLKLTCQAIKCSFDGVDKPLDPETKSQITSVLQNGPISIKFISLSNGICKVQVVVEGNNINDCVKEVLNPESDAPVSESTENLSKDMKIPTPEIPADGQEISCVFSVFVSDTEFCVSKLETLNQLIELGENLTKHCENASKVSLPSVGDYVCALFEGGWYRAEVKDVLGEHVFVYFVDFGNSSEISIDYVRASLPEHLQLPCQAIKCSFDGVDKPLDLETKKQMTTILQSNSFKIKFISASNGVHNVQVTLEGNNINDCLKETLNPETEAPVAERTENPPKHAPLPESREDSPEHVQIPPPEIPADGQEISCVFSGFVSDTEFCVSKLETLKELIELGENLTKHCKSSAESGSAPLEGDYVCALFEGSWYRGRVKSVEGDMIALYFVDNGNSGDIHKNDIRTLLSEHSKLPCQAIKCSLTGLECSLNDKQRKDITAILEKNYFTVRFVTKKSDLCEVEISSISEFISTNFDHFEEKPIPEQDYPTDGSHFGAIVTSCISDNKFCVLIKDQILGLSKLMEKISVFCSSESQSYSAKIGDYVCALYNTDGYWYRAKIVNLEKSGYQVYFIDYGNTDHVDAPNIRKLVSGLRTFPTQAILCRLFGVKSVEKEFFEKLMTTHVQVEVVEQVEGINFVKLWLEDGSCINDVFDEDQSEVLPQSSCIQLPLPSDDPTMSLTKDNSVEFEIQYIDSMSNFFIQLTHPNCKEALQKIEKEVLECCQAAIPYRPAVGEYVCCLYEGLWYRAHVKCIEDDVYIVNLVDYGNKIRISSDSIRKFNTKLASFPPLAYQCCLDKISDDQQNMAKFAEALTCDHCTKIKLIRKQNGVHVVEIVLSNGQFLSDVLSADNPANTNISDSPPATMKALERHTVDELQFIVPLDSELTVIFTYVKDPYNIYCHSASEEGAEAMTKVQEMCLNKMVPYCENSDMTLEPQINEVYCGKYINDWYRCVVLEFCEENILVRFLDMGEEKEIPLCDLRPILPEFLALPVSIFRCSLNGVKTIGNRWGTGASHLIRSICNETNKLNVVKREKEVLFCDVMTCRGVDLRQELIKQCLAEEAVEPIDNSPDDEDDEEEIRRQIAELQAKLLKKGRTFNR